jgi:hypothetical protein
MLYFVILLTLILLFYSTFDIDLTEFVMIVCGFVFIIWVLLKHGNRKTELYEEAEVVINEPRDDPELVTVSEEQRDPRPARQQCSLSSAMNALVSIPSIVQKNIEPAIDHLINSVNDESESSDLENNKSITSGPYADKKDTYVGTVRISVETDTMGQKEDVEVFSLDQKLFNKMKAEYKTIDTVLKVLEEGNPELYNQIIQ